MERPRLIEPTSQHPPNVLIVRGLPWHVTESQAKRAFGSTLHIPRTVRAYEDPHNGASRGIFFVEYEAGTSLQEMAQVLQDQQHFHLTVQPYHLTNTKWDRGGGLPELPTDSAFAVGLKGPVEGFGPQGYEIRCGEELGLANTTRFPEEMERVRKRLRETAATSAAAAPSAHSGK